MLTWLLARWRAKSPVQQEIAATASGQSVAIVGDNINSPIQVGPDAEDLRLVFEQTLDQKLAEISRTTDVPEAPLRAVLKKLGEAHVARAEIPDRLAKAADELLRLRADLTRLNNDHPEFAAIRARASAAIDKGNFDAARAALNEGRQAARALREEADRTEAGFLAQEARVDRLQLNYDAACAKFAEAARLDSNDVWLRIELGDLWRTRGSLGQATTAYSAACDCAARSGHVRDLAASYDRLGQMQFAQDDLTGALTSYNHALLIAQQLAESDPSNVHYQRDLSVSHHKIGDVQVAQGDLAGALISNCDGLAIVEQLAGSNPGNVEWEYDLCASHTFVGDVQFARLDLANALKSYNQGFAIIARLAQTDPRDARWQRDLYVSYSKIGNVQAAHGDLEAALTSYRKGLSITDQLVLSDAGNAEWKHDLAVVHGNIGFCLRNKKMVQEALKALEKGCAILARLVADSPDNAKWKRDLDRFKAQIAEISQ